MYKLRTIAPLLVFLICGVACSMEEQEPEPVEQKDTVGIAKEAFGLMPDGTPVDLYTLTNNNGCEAKITNFGGIVVSLVVPDLEGNLSDVVLGFDSLDPYLVNTPHFGALIGRYGNRIGNGRFVLDDVEYQLATNNGENHLHGGLQGYDKVLWKAEVVKDGEGEALRLRYVSKGGEEGYPGELSVEVSYRLTNDDGLQIDYKATTNEKTVVNLTHHSYFNLKDAGASSVLEHEMQIVADRFTPVDSGLIPTGELRSVEGTAMDFRQSLPIGARIENDEEQLKFGGGYDHNWVLNNQDGTLALAARVYEPVTGRILEVLTTEPGLQFYSGNFLDGTEDGKGGVRYEHRSGFCLEAQHYPDSPNKPEFPSTVLEPGEVYTQTTIYRFSTK